MLTFTLRVYSTPPWIRTKTERGLNPMPLPIGLVEHCMGREIRTLKILILNQVRLPFRHPHIFILYSVGESNSYFLIESQAY